jgi:hypothetical protein
MRAEADQTLRLCPCLPPRAEKLEGQLAELQRKYRIMQGDKQAYAESSSLTLRKQRCAPRSNRRARPPPCAAHAPPAHAPGCLLLRQGPY